MQLCIARGEKIYWICPAISESEISDLVSAESKYQELITIFDPKIVGLVHGKISDNNQEKIISNRETIYKKSDTDII